jgi:hypothetical protein
MSSADRIKARQQQQLSTHKSTKAKPLSKYISIFLLPLCQQLTKREEEERKKGHLDLISFIHSILH